MRQSVARARRIPRLPHTLLAVSLSLAASLGLMACSPLATRAPLDPSLPVGDVLMLDMRHFCDTPPEKGACIQPVRRLPAALREAWVKHRIGGSILFAENLADADQIRALTADLQSARASDETLPMLIGIDQEGGRVARLPRHLSPPFAGNMAIGATFAQHGDAFARSVAERMGRDLAAFGFNVNFAPNVDVNVNPQNPVINVRSYSDDPARVGALGAATVRGLQAQGVMATAKHFPGHGDTQVDSHSGLPRVEHDRATVARVDLAPFAQLIREAPPALIMTAHIQYPALDAHTLRNQQGEAMTVPATLSAHILQKLLREDMQFKGVVISDAMNMAAISANWDAHTAATEALRAGVDLLLMPVVVRTPADLKKLDALVHHLRETAARDARFAARIREAAARVRALRKNLAQPAPARLVAPPISEAMLAEAAITAVHDQGRVLPLNASLREGIVLLMPDREKCAAMMAALQAERLSARTCVSLLSDPVSAMETALKQARVLITARINPQQSVAEMGGVDDAPSLAALSALQKESQPRQQALLQMAHAAAVPKIAVSLRAPYDLAGWARCADAAIATYHYNIDNSERVKAFGEVPQGSAYTALAGVLSGRVKPTGQLPVQVPGLDKPCAL